MTQRCRCATIIDNYILKQIKKMDTYLVKKCLHLIFIHAVEAPKSDELLEMVDGGEAGHSHVLPWQLLQL
jgi:hypothetical protein